MKLVPLTGKRGIGKFALVDDEDYDKVIKYRWYFHRDGYCYSAKLVEGKRKRFYMHRFIMNECIFKNKIDHINDIRLDNQKSNMRICSNKENISRQLKVLGRSSRFKGVCWNKKSKKWRTQIMHYGKNISLGFFDNEIEAAIAYNNKAIELFGEYVRLNNVCQIQ